MSSVASKCLYLIFETKDSQERAFLNCLNEKKKNFLKM